MVFLGMKYPAMLKGQSHVINVQHPLQHLNRLSQMYYTAYR